MRFISKNRVVTMLVGFVLLTGSFLLVASHASAACNDPNPSFGTVSFSNLTVPETGTYRVWTRMQIPDTAKNNYFLEVNGGTCYIVNGLGSIPKNSWQWVDYHSGTVSSKINVNLTAGSPFPMRLLGTSEGVLVDRILFTKVSNGETCTPSGIGDDCADPVNAPPVVSSFTSSTNSTTTGTNYTLTANASDSNGTLTNISIFQNGVATPLKSCPVTTASASCSHTLNSPAGGSFSYSSRATDNGGATTTSNTITVNVTAPVAKVGDCTNDNVVGIDDLTKMGTNWLKPNATLSDCNFSGDTTVNIDDLTILASKWGQ